MDRTDPSTQPGVLLSHDGPVAFITLNRPEVYNAVDDSVTRLLLAAISEIESSPMARVIVFRGMGKGFCAGGDLPFFSSRGDALRETVDRMLGDGNRFLLALRQTNKPVLASVHGVAAGAGMSLVSACDFCIAASDATFIPGYAKLAISPDLGGTANLVRAVGYRNAMRVFLLEDRLSAAQAERLGLVTRIVEPADLAASTLALARKLAALPRAAAESTKALLRSAMEVDLSEQLNAELDSFHACIHAPETQAALERFNKK